MKASDLQPASLQTEYATARDLGLKPHVSGKSRFTTKLGCPACGGGLETQANSGIKTNCLKCGKSGIVLADLGKDVRTPTAIDEPTAPASDNAPVSPVEAPTGDDQNQDVETVAPARPSPDSAPAKPDAPRFKLPEFSGCGEDELNNAKLHPKCIVENMYYSDVGALFAPGGVGKTTLKIYESICIALGRDLWGCPVINPGKTIIMTAEDSKDLILARMREMMNSMRLTPIERGIVMSHIMVIDVSGDIQRLAESDTANNLVITSLADSIVERYQNDHIAQFIFDPAIRFGPGERYINDGEDMIIIACRRIVRGLGCMVQIIHHTGKANARSGSLDQYSGRGGSAFSDGCRMVTVLSNNGEMKNPPEGFELLPGDSGFVMARPKLSYCKPQPNIWIRRHGWEFDYFTEEVKSNDEILSRNMDKIANFIRDELHHGRKYSKKSLESTSLNELKMSRQELRATLSALEVCGRVVEKDLPEEERQGSRKHFLFVLTAPR